MQLPEHVTLCEQCGCAPAHDMTIPKWVFREVGDCTCNDAHGSIMEQVAQALNRFGTGVAFVRSPKGCPSIEYDSRLHADTEGMGIYSGKDVLGRTIRASQGDTDCIIMDISIADGQWAAVLNVIGAGVEEPWQEIPGADQTCHLTAPGVPTDGDGDAIAALLQLAWFDYAHDYLVPIVPPLKLLHIQTDDGVVVVPLHQYLADEESLSIEEMYELNTLQPGQTYVMSLHFAGQAVFRVYYAADQRER